jgi:hypothetical protein
MTEQDRVVGLHNKREQSPAVSGGPPVAVEYDDVHMSDLPVLQVPDDPGKLDEFGIP